MSEKTMFPREDHTEMLFQKILNDPWACDRLMETFNENLVYNDEFDVSLPAEKFAKAYGRGCDSKSRDCRDSSGGGDTAEKYMYGI
jgi:hypothetical protein